VAIGEEDLSLIDLGPYEVVIENEASIISSGTELATLNGSINNAKFPVRPGYGSIGRIIAKGETLSHFEIGQRVFYAGKHASVQKFDCNGGNQWQFLFPVPEQLDAIEAVIGCMAEIAMCAPNLTQLKIGDRVVVFGLGLVGNLAAQFYQLCGAKVLGVDPVAERCQRARDVGIEHTLDVPPDQQVQAIMDWTGGKGAHVTVDAVGHSAIIENCVHTTTNHGQVLLLGSPRAPFSRDNITPLWYLIHNKNLLIKGSHMKGIPLHSGIRPDVSVEWAFNLIFDLIDSRKLKVLPLISHILAPHEAIEAYEGLMNRQHEYTGVVIDWRRTESQ